MAMRGVTLITLLAFVTQIHATEVAANFLNDSQHSMDKFVDKLVDGLANKLNEKGESMLDRVLSLRGGMAPMKAMKVSKAIKATKTMKAMKAVEKKPVPQAIKATMAMKAMKAMEKKPVSKVAKGESVKSVTLLGSKGKGKGKGQTNIEMKKINLAKIYLASGWFNPTQAKELTQLEEICDKRKWIDLISPRRVFVCPPNAAKEVQVETFDGNLHHIKSSDFLIVNVRDNDVGTIWEAGYAHAHDKPIIYFSQGLSEGAKFNLMLACSGVKLCTSFKELEAYLDRVHQLWELPYEPYDKSIE